MKIAFDGGSFQQGIAGGIFTVSVGLLNAAAALDPDFSCVLVADSRLGPVREELVAQLNFRPEVVYGEIAPAISMEMVISSDSLASIEMGMRPRPLVQR